jgi:phage gp46-like protein
VTQQQQGDVLLFQTPDNGEIVVANGVTTMTGFFETATYASLFGGNQKDSTRADDPNNWWGNLGEPAANQYRSETQYLIGELPATSGNLRKLEDAATRDLAWFLSEKIASDIVVSASIPELNRVTIAGTITARGQESAFSYTENWKAGQ